MSRRKRVLLWVGLLVVLAGAGLGLLAWLLPSDRHIIRESYDAIGPSMTVLEVEMLLGGPAGDYTHGQYMVANLSGNHAEFDIEVYEITAKRNRSWIGSQGLVQVSFDEHDKIAVKSFFPVVPTDETLLDRLRRWLGL